MLLTELSRRRQDGRVGDKKGVELDNGEKRRNE